MQTSICTLDKKGIKGIYIKYKKAKEKNMKSRKALGE